MLLKQIITEKSSTNKRNNKVTFMVTTNFNKKEIINFTQYFFKIKVVAINTCIYRGKIKRIGASTGKLKNWKKVIIQISNKEGMEKFEEALVNGK